MSTNLFEATRAPARRAASPQARRRANAARRRANGGRGLTAAQTPQPLARSLSLIAKRLFDIGAATMGFALAWPIILLIALLVVATSRGPAIFWSTRVGRHGRLFQMPKFRTMRVGVLLCPREQLSIAEADFTPFGRILRRTGLDELPQLFSVLTGDMSIIGPRPLLASDPAAHERLNFPEALTVRPGISGLAQVNGRNALTPRRKARLDALYARAVCLRVDALLLVKTAMVIVSGKGFL